MTKIQEKVQEKVQDKIVSKKIRESRSLHLQSYVMIISAAFLALAIAARFIPYFPIDLTITRAIQHISAGWFYTLMSAISFIGYSPQEMIIVSIIVGGLFVSGLRWEAIVGTINAVTITIMSIFLKTTVHRVRPNIDLVHVFRHLGEYSFPSGHVLFYTSFFGYLFFLTYSLMKKSNLRTIILSILGMFIVLIAPSRIYLGAHWASDVLGAYMFGSVWLLLIIYIYRSGKKRFFQTQPTA